MEPVIVKLEEDQGPAVVVPHDPNSDPAKVDKSVNDALALNAMPKAPQQMVAPHQPQAHEVRTSSSQSQLTPAAEDEKARTSANQRAVNIMWERTQAFIALLVVTVWACTSAYMIVVAEEAHKQVYYAALSSTTLLVIGFYFGRTNHQRTGGVGGDVTGR